MDNEISDMIEDIEEEFMDVMDEDELQGIVGKEIDDAIDFIDNGAIRDWLSFVCATTAREVTLGDFRLFAQHFLISREKVGVEELEPFLESIPAKLNWAIEYVTPQRLHAFREKAIERSAAAVGEYLNEDS